MALWAKQHKCTLEAVRDTFTKTKNKKTQRRNSLDIKETIDKYCAQKEVEKTLKKDISTLSGTIKNYMLSNNSEDLSTDKFKVHLGERVTETVNEEQMLTVLKEYWSTNYSTVECPYIRTKEYVDTDVLESMIYNGEIPNEVLLELDKCRSKTVSSVLTYKVKKEGD